MKRFLAGIVAAILFASNANAITAGQRLIILGGVQSWTLPGSSADLYFSRNAGSCSVKRIFQPCTNLLTTTRAQTVSSYAQWLDGHFSSFAANMARITDQGLLTEITTVNKALWSNDWTNAAYVKVNTTAALDQTGPDNVANSASSVTATANAGTILQTVTEVAATNTESVYLKRITGTGTITLVQNGVSGTVCTLTTTAWTQCSVTGSVLNPALGIIMATNGDKIAVWGEQFEANAFSTSPIPTTTVAVTRNGDQVFLAGAAQTAGLSFPQWNYTSFMVSQVVAGVNYFVTSVGDQTTNNRVETNIFTSGVMQYRDVAGGVASNPANSAGSVTQGVKQAVARSVSIGTGTDVTSLNGGTTTSSSPAAMPVSNRFALGSNGGSGGAANTQLNGYIREFAIGNSILTGASVQALSVTAR